MSGSPAQIIDPPRVPSFGTRQAVSSSHPAISSVGMSVLESGGNAVDASLAMAAVSWLVLPGQAGIGGDAFVLVVEPDGEVWTVNGSGFGPDLVDADTLREQGHRVIPPVGPQSVAVPGAVAAIAALHRRGGTRELADLWRPAVQMARDGVPCTAKNLRDISGFETALAADPQTAAVFLPGGRLPRIGQRLVHAKMADTIERLAVDPESFYTGDFADRAVQFLAGAGFTGEEWTAGARVSPEPAISIDYAGARVHQTPLPSAGWMVLQQLAIIEGNLGEQQLGPEAVWWLAAAARTAFDDRQRVVSADSEAWRDLLSPGHIDTIRRAIAEHRVPNTPTELNPDGDTTTTVCVDAEGRAVSFIQSLAFTYGACIAVPDTGVLLNNRLSRGAYLTEGHPNELRPRRKPLHTLNAWAVTEPAGRLRHVGACPGGDGQVQWNTQIISHLLDHGDDPARAVSLPRLNVYPGSDARDIGQPDQVRCERGIDQEITATLRSRGLDAVSVGVQLGGPGGSATVISVDADGTLAAAADPRLEGVGLAR